MYYKSTYLTQKLKPINQDKFIEENKITNILSDKSKHIYKKKTIKEIPLIR